MKYIKFYFFAVLALTFFLTPVVSVGAQFDPLGKACEGNSSDPSCNESSSAQPGGENSENPVVETIADVANVVSLAIGAISIIIIIIAGMSMVLSGGDSAKIKSSRDAIIYAAVGIVVAALAQGIIILVINRTLTDV